MDQRSQMTGPGHVTAQRLMNQLLKHLHSKKGQDKTLPASLWMRYKAVGQSVRYWLLISSGRVHARSARNSGRFLA